MTDEKLLTEKTTTHATHVVHKEPKPSLLSSVLAIVGFIILIVIVLWGLLHIATLASPWLSSLFNNKTSNSIQVTAPASVTSGENFTLIWKYSTSEKGMYAIVYQCKNNFHLETSGADGTKNAVPCGAAFTVSPGGNSVVLTPRLSGTASTSVPISVVFIPSATSSKQVQGGATVLILPSAVPAGRVVVDPVIPTRTLVATPADLSVRILGANVDASGYAIVDFDIANNGGSSSGTYYFEAYLPTQGAYTYSSPAQSPLGPGDHILNTLRFSQTVPGSISVIVDPAHSVKESNENNNYASQAINAPYLPVQAGQYPYVY